jgi:hypothetical protein
VISPPPAPKPESRLAFALKRPQPPNAAAVKKKKGAAARRKPRLQLD